jgi:hypothetical protein
LGPFFIARQANRVKKDDNGFASQRAKERPNTEWIDV